MAINKHINSRARRIADFGLGNQTEDYGGRFFLKDGRPNVRYDGISFFERISFFDSLMGMSWLRFLAIIILLFGMVNIVFALLYFTLGVEGLYGEEATTGLGRFWEAFFFSTQTLTTVGYGHLAPESFSINLVAALEAMTGWLCFAMATGLIYGRFARPKMHLKYSESAVIAPFENGTGLMVKVAPFKANHHLLDAQAMMTLAMVREVNGVSKNEFYRLDLEYETVNALSLSWTIVHPINETSPLFGLSFQEIKDLQTELIVFVKAFDDSFNASVTSRSSYTASEIKHGYKFVTIFHRNSSGGSTVLELDKLDKIEKVTLPLSTLAEP